MTSTRKDNCLQNNQVVGSNPTASAIGDYMLHKDNLLQTTRSKILAAAAAIVLGTGVVITLTSDGCQVTKLDQTSADAGAPVTPVEEQGEGEGEGEASSSPSDGL